MGIIVKHANSRYSISKTIIWKGTAVLLFFLLVGWAIRWFVLFPGSGQYEYIHCDAEQLKSVNQKKVFFKDGKVFNNGHTRSDHQARTGKYASKIDSTQPYGFHYELENYRTGDQFYVSVWRKAIDGFHGLLAIQFTGDKEDFQRTEHVTERDQAGWERLEHVFVIPPDFIKGRITIYAYGWGKGAAYFDDLEIRRISRDRFFEQLAKQDTLLPDLHLYINRQQWRKLTQKRSEALNIGILTTAEDSWVKGKIQEEETELPVKLRLKGDWIDHLRTDKWSFRIQTQYPFDWKRHQNFSIQHPQTRNYLHEWVFHQWLDYEDVLSTQYDFLFLHLNRERKGLYAIESHFDKQLPEFRQRREGPILKFDETAVWQARSRGKGLDHQVEGILPTFEAADIQTFQEKRLQKDTVFLQQFGIAQSLMEQFKFGKKEASDIFDLDLMAKYYAIVDITQAYHSLVWHNLRFYYNPVSSKLEPIGFDGYTELGIMRFSSRPLIGSNVVSRQEPFLHQLHIQLFKDPQLTEKYVFYLEKFTDSLYVKSFLLSIRNARSSRLSSIQKEFPNYTCDPEMYVERAAAIRRMMYPLSTAGIRAFKMNGNIDSAAFRVTNHHILPLQIVGWGKQSDQMTEELSEPVLLPPYDKGRLASYQDIIGPVNSRFIIYQLPGLKQLYHAPISSSPPSWAVPETPLQKLSNKAKIRTNPLYTVTDQEVRFSKGSYQVDSLLLIPKNHEVVFEAGCQIDFVKGGGLISYSPVLMRGSEEQPIIIRSSDHRARGFTIFQAKARSALEYVRFEGLNTLKMGAWQLTGAVCFYDSDVSMKHCAFLQGQSEDALNLIRSEFELQNCLINGAAYDGLDVDFCTGTLQGVKCMNSGNDGLDFSGSFIRIIDTYIEGAGDKGISVGEEAHVRIYNATILDTKTGLASKDLSVVDIDQISLKNSQTALAAYQKKPAYGGGKINIKQYETENIRFLHQVESGSLIKFPDFVVEGK